MRKSLVAAAIAVGVMTPLAGCGGQQLTPVQPIVLTKWVMLFPPITATAVTWAEATCFSWAAFTATPTTWVSESRAATSPVAGRFARVTPQPASRQVCRSLAASGNGTRVTTKPAAPQQAPKSPSAPFSGSTKANTSASTSTSTRSSTGGFSSSTSRSSSSSSSRSSSSGGRK
jgi:uncharacterized membrane protein YgcG